MRPKPSFLTRFKRSRWYPIFWLVIFLLLFSSGVVVYYFMVVNRSAVSTKHNTVQQANDTNTHLRVTTSSTNLVATDNFDQGTQLTVALLDKDNQPRSTDSDIIVTVSSSADTGKFDSGSSVTINAQQSSANLRYIDTKVGKPVLNFFATGMTAITVNIDIQPAPASNITPIKLLTKGSVTSQPADSDIGLSTTLIDNFGNIVTGGKISWQQVAPNKTRDTIADDTGRSFFMAHFERRDSAYTTSVVATFGSKKQSISLTIQP